MWYEPALSLPTNPKSLPLPDGAGKPELEEPGDGPLRLAIKKKKEMSLDAHQC